MLTVSTNERLDSLSASLAESVHHEQQQRQDEEGGDAADDQAHPTGHRVKQTVSIWETKTALVLPLLSARLLTFHTSSRHLSQWRETGQLAQSANLRTNSIR